MKIYVNSEPEEIPYRNEFVVEITVGYETLTDFLEVSGFQIDSEDSKEELKSLLTLLKKMTEVSSRSLDYYKIKDFKKWFEVRLSNNKKSIDWPMNLLDSKKPATLENYDVFYYDENGLKYSTIVKLN